jgi:beta-N-acetylhexosaminidase
VSVIKNLLLSVCCFIGFQSFAQTDQFQWAENQMLGMTLDEKIGQFFMVPAYSNREEAHAQKIESLILNHKVGGIIFFQGAPFQQAILTNRFQNLSKTPLLIGIDGETGLGMRLNDAIDMPKALTLGAIQDDNVVFRLGQEIGRECSRLGVHINFAPSADIASEASNPIISTLGRSFGEWKENVANKSTQFALGIQSQNVMAVAKHFPGHGATLTDSHFYLPIIYQSYSELIDRELYPFQRMVESGVGGVLTGHLQVPNLDNQLNMPASTSKKIITDLLKSQMNFNGIVFTDAMNMKAISKIYDSPGEADLQAFMAGNDIILQSENPIEGIKKIKAAVEKGRIDINEIDERVRKILIAKFRLGLSNRPSIDLNNLLKDLNDPIGHAIKQEAFENAVTIIKNDGTLPISQLDQTSFASVAISSKSGDSFQRYLSKYANFKHFNVNYKPGNDAELNPILEAASKFNTVVVSIHDVNGSGSKNYGITAATQRFIEKLQAKTKVIVCIFGSPYSLKMFSHLPNVLCAYEDDQVAQQVVPQILFGALAAKGKLPVSINSEIGAGHGIDSPRLGRLSYGFPENMGFQSKKFDEIDRIAQEGINARAYPGCQVLVAKNGKVIYAKNFGSLTYNGVQQVNDETLYDIASMTKVSSTLQAVMSLYEKGAISVQQKASDYLPELLNTNKQDLYINDLLLHQAGLLAFVPFYDKTKLSGGFKTGFYSFSGKTDNFPNEVAEGIYTSPSMKDSVWNWLIQTPLTAANTGNFRFHYSDLGLMILQRIIEKQSNQSLDVLVGNQFFKPLGMSQTLFNPKSQFSKENIAPTEQENSFRRQMLQGTVHDPNAALVGGVSGHAGLFSTANDLAKLFQMNLQEGSYGQQQFLKPSTIQYFTQRNSNRSHRGLGWDKPDQNNPGNVGNIVGTTASSSTYGHSGFTGTAGWVDPSKQLVYIFLSNRVHPSINNRLMTLKTRQRIHDAINEAITTRTNEF